MEGNATCRSREGQEGGRKGEKRGEKRGRDVRARPLKQTKGREAEQCTVLPTISHGCRPRLSRKGKAAPNKLQSFSSTLLLREKTRHNEINHVQPKVRLNVRTHAQPSVTYHAGNAPGPLLMYNCQMNKLQNAT